MLCLLRGGFLGVYFEVHCSLHCGVAAFARLSSSPTSMCSSYRVPILYDHAAGSRASFGSCGVCHCKCPTKTSKKEILIERRGVSPGKTVCRPVPPNLGKAPGTGRKEPTLAADGSPIGDAPEYGHSVAVLPAHRAAGSHCDRTVVSDGAENRFAVISGRLSLAGGAGKQDRRTEGDAG